MANTDIIPEYVDTQEIVVIASTNTGPCKIKRDKKADQNKKVPGDSPLAEDIREITQSILAETDCDALQMKVKTAVNGLKDDLQDKLGLTKEKLAEINPLLSIPLNPFKLPGYIKKQTIGRMLPDLDATIDLIVKTTEVVSAISELTNAVSRVVPNLKACTIDLKDDIKRQIDDQIDQLVDDVKSEIAKTIAEAICQGVNAAGITANDIEGAITVVKVVNDLETELKDLKSSSEELLKSNIDSIGSTQTTIQELTGVPGVLDTTSFDGFIASTQSEEYQQYKETVKSVLSIPEPVANTLPVVTGNSVVGSTLTCSNGEWSANGNSLTYAHQWFRNGLEISGANTFTYIPVLDDVETKLYCMVTAQTNVTVEQAKSNETDFIAFALESANKPSITGTPTVGSILSCSTGTWPFTPTILQYEWIRGESNIVQSLSGNNYYKVVSADVGSSLKCRVVAQSFRYALSDTSNSISVI